MVEINELGAMTIKKMIDASREWTPDQLAYELGRGHTCGARLELSHSRMDDPDSIIDLLNAGHQIYKYLVDREEYWGIATTARAEMRGVSGSDWMEQYAVGNAHD